MSIAIKISVLRNQVKDLLDMNDNVPSSTMDLILTGINTKLREIQEDCNKLESNNKVSVNKNRD